MRSCCARSRQEAPLAAQADQAGKEADAAAAGKQRLYRTRWNG